MRLKKLLIEGKEIDSLTQHLVLEGYSYEEAKAGLEPFVLSWEESVKYIEQSNYEDIDYSEEYDHDLWARTELYYVLQHATKEQIKTFSQRIKQTDLRFKNVTVTTNIANNHIDEPDKNIHWWLFRDRY